MQFGSTVLLFPLSVVEYMERWWHAGVLSSQAHLELPAFGAKRSERAGQK